MKTAFIIPGSGESFYCQNCLRDYALIKSLKKLGLDCFIVPLYLPLSNKNEIPDAKQSPIFYGAINSFLKEKIPFYANIPEVIKQALDSDIALSFAARQSSATSARGLESLTISIIEGEEGRHRKELEKLVNWLKNNETPEIVHISNALLIGMAKKIKKEIGASTICTIQDERQWIDSMSPEHAKKVYELIRKNSEFVDGFISVSRWYSQYFSQKTGIPIERFQVIYPGIENTAGSKSANFAMEGKKSIGYISRLSESLGFGILADGILELLKGGDQFRDVCLLACGGYSASDKKFISKTIAKFAELGFEKNIKIIPGFDQKAKREVLENSILFSVPNPDGEAFGMELLEAFSFGIPAVLPASGAYPEIISESGAGVIFSPNTPEKLAETLAQVLQDTALRISLSANASNSAVNQFSIANSAKNYYQMFLRLKE